ncbi:DNA repair endonuclease-like protein [Moniliophthora roreri]|nr:DNA repair endonuclease-like protein [Moniliophthora roreri]
MGLTGLWPLFNLYKQTKSFAEIAAEKGFVRNFNTSCTLTVGMDLSPILDSFQAKKIALGRKVLHSPTDLTQSQFFWLVSQLSETTTCNIVIFDTVSRPRQKRGTNVMVQKEPYHYDYAKPFIYPAGFHFHTAPGETDAELVEMYKRGLIDIVLTSDSNVFALSPAASVYSRNSKESKCWAELIVDLYDVPLIMQSLALSQEQFILYALMVGNDLDKSIPNCRPVLALGAAQAVSMLFLQQYNQLLKAGHKNKVTKLLYQLKSEIIHIMKENPVGTLPHKAPAIADFLHTHNFPLRQGFVQAVFSITNLMQQVLLALNLHQALHYATIQISDSDADIKFGEVMIHSNYIDLTVNT